MSRLRGRDRIVSRTRSANTLKSCKRICQMSIIPLKVLPMHSCETSGCGMAKYLINVRRAASMGGHDEEMQWRKMTGSPPAMISENEMRETVVGQTPTPGNSDRIHQWKSTLSPGQTWLSTSSRAPPCSASLLACTSRRPYRLLRSV